LIRNFEHICIRHLLNLKSNCCSIFILAILLICSYFLIYFIFIVAFPIFLHSLKIYVTSKTDVTKKKRIIADRAPHSFPSSGFRGRKRTKSARWVVGVGCKFALNEMRRYGAFQSEVNSFPTINCIPPPMYHPCSTLSLSLSLSLCLFAVHPLALSQLSFSFSLVLHIHIVLLASRRTRHVPATYIVPPNNVCPKGREITDFDGRRISRVNRKSTRKKKRATSTSDIHGRATHSLFTAAIVTFACLACHQWHAGLGKGNTTAAANSF